MGSVRRSYSEPSIASDKSGAATMTYPTFLLLASRGSV